MENRKIIEYIYIISFNCPIETDEDYFENRVTKAIEDGYELFGKTKMKLDKNYSVTLMQAMVKYEDYPLKNTRKFIELLEKKLSQEEIDEIEEEAKKAREEIKNEKP